MRRSVHGRRFGLSLRTLAPAVIAIGFLLLTGCEDSRISVQEFIAMQERMARESQSRNEIPQSCAPRSCVSREDACRLSRPCPPKARKPKPAAAAHTPTIDAPRPEPVHSGSSAVRDSRIVQVRAESQPEDEAKGNWYFDARRGEWVRVKLPRKTKNRPTFRTSLVANQDESYAAPPSESDDDGAETSNETTSAPADSDETPHFVPVQANVPLRNEPLQPVEDLVQLAKRPYLLGPEDLLTVTLTGLTGIDTIAEPAGIEARVAHDGTINLPLVGAIHIAGLDIVSAENVIREAYVPKFVPTLAVGIRVEAFKTADVVVVGAAELPGIVNLRRNQQTVLHAVAAAGGMTQAASGEVVLQRMRDPENKIRVFLRNSADLKAVLAMDPLESGDVIEVVAAQPNTIFVGGLVNMPGPREFPQGTEVTALQALAAAGGPVEAVFPKDATLIRRMPNGEDVHVRIDLEKLRSGEETNLKLAAGDIFWVPETWGTRTMAFINQSFFIRAGATVSYNVTGIEFLNRPRQQVGNVGQTGGGTLQNNVDPLGFLAP
ncbi:MAG TPA: polysaccharide biosynthesis/export family protein [Phycisphaerae bacterium]|nr:polysaccharide biosynthesis/export family protein [Phycisphaerae bacterium]